jgi:peptidoglycan lytic transglycosylase
MTGRRRLPHACLAVALALWLGGCAGQRTHAPPPAAPEPEVPAVTPPAPQAPHSDAELLRLPDAVPRVEPRARLGNPPFYEVYGVRYTVLAGVAGYLERGVASWYGRDFHGARTAIGESYDMYAMTAAHKTLPLPAYAQVTNLRNGRSVVVRINDRGPFKANRIIDLSYTAALKLDMLRDGTTLVEVRAVEAGPAPPPPRAATLYVQAGAFTLADNAERLRARLAAAGLKSAFVRTEHVREQLLYRVRVGPVSNVAEFDRLVAQLRELGVTDARLAVD